MRNQVRWLTAVAMAAAALGAREARAWDSLCLQIPQGDITSPTTDSDFCRWLKDDQCIEGIAAARGRFLSEHTFITATAMKMAGLDDFLGRSAFPYYYTKDATAPDGSTPSFEPVSAPSAQKYVSASAPVFRFMTTPELAQLPDHSYSLSDLLLGNEKCLVENSPCRTDGLNTTTLDATHNFAPHMGEVNSPHFSPQARSAYRLFHGIAKSIAERCRRMKDAVSDDDYTRGLTAQGFLIHPHPFLDDAIGTPTMPEGSPLETSVLYNQVQSCEREALGFEAIASHYLEDAWSAGHMWERWGTPLFHDNPFDRQDAMIVAMTAGIIHGSRGVFDANAASLCSTLAVDGRRPLESEQIPSSCSFDLINAFNDQMCLPGPYDVVNDSFSDSTSVEWRYIDGNNPSGAATPPGIGRGTSRFYAAGDLFLLPCRARGHVSVLDPVTANAAYMEAQRSTMFNCVARGFAEVYNMGPRTVTNGQPLSAVAVTVPADQDDYCWQQRMTNRSIYLGWGFSGVPGSGIPSLFAKGVLVAFSKLNVGPALVNLPILNLRLSIALQQELSLLTFFEQHDPYGTAMATSALLAAGDTFFSAGPNSAEEWRVDGYDSQNQQNLVSYFDGRYPEQWKSEFQNGTSCTSDTDCAPGRYCAIQSNGQSLCQRQESAVLSVFRGGETPNWCVSDDKTALEAAALACQVSGGSATVACNACVDAVIPHLRNACDDKTFVRSVHAYTWDPYDTTQDNTLYQARSLCDVYDDNAIIPAPGKIMPVYRLYDPTTPGKAREAAQAFCSEGRQIHFADPHDAGVTRIDPGLGPAASQDTYVYGPTGTKQIYDPELASGCIPFSVCGATTRPGHISYYDKAEGATHHHRFRLHALPIVEPDHTEHVAKLVPLDRSEMALQARTEDCSGVNPSAEVRADGNDLVLDWTVTQGQPDSLCIRIMSKSYTVWSASVTSENDAVCW